MTIKTSRLRAAPAGVVIAALLTACGTHSTPVGANALTLADQGSFAVGGTVATAPGQFDPLRPAQSQGQTYLGDHAYAFYQVPENARRLPLVMLHGTGQSSKTWETTADGREGFPKLVSAPRLRHLLGRPATPRRRRAQHGGHHADPDTG